MLVAPPALGPLLAEAAAMREVSAGQRPELLHLRRRLHPGQHSSRNLYLAACWAIS